MSTFLLTWELGCGLGHMMQMLPMARELGRRGHRVFCALRDLSSAVRVFGDEPIALLQAPVRVGRRIDPVNGPRTLAQILHNRLSNNSVRSAERAFPGHLSARWEMGDRGRNQTPWLALRIPIERPPIPGLARLCATPGCRATVARQLSRCLHPDTLKDGGIHYKGNLYTSWIVTPGRTWI